MSLRLLKLILLFSIPLLSEAQICSEFPTSIANLFYQYHPRQVLHHFESQKACFEKINQKDQVAVLSFVARAQLDLNHLEQAGSLLDSLGILYDPDLFGSPYYLAKIQLALEYGEFAQLDSLFSQLERLETQGYPFADLERLLYTAIAAFHRIQYEQCKVYLDSIAGQFPLPDTFHRTQLVFEHYNAKWEQTSGDMDTGYQLVVQLGQKVKPAYERSYFYAKILGDQASVLMNKKKYEESFQLLDQSNALLRLLEDTINSQAVANQNWEGIINYYQGNFGGSIKCWRKAVDILNALFDENHPSIGDFTSNLSIAYEKFGNNELALKYAQASLDNTEYNVGKLNRDYITSLNNYGYILKNMERFTEAKPILLQVVHLCDSIGYTTTSRYGTYLDNLGSLYRNIGAIDSAIYYGERAVKNAENTVGKSSYFYNIRSNNLALSYRSNGDIQKAQEIYKELIPVTEQVFGKHHMQNAVRLSNYALVSRDLKDYDQATEAYQKSTKHFIHQIYNYYPSLSAEEKLKFLQRERSLIDSHFSYLFDQQNATVFNYLEHLNLTLKGLALSSHIALNDLNQVIPSEEFEQWKNLKEQIAKSTIRRGHGSNLDSLLEVKNRMEVDFLSSTHMDFQIQNILPTDIQTKLNSDEVAIDFFHFQKVDKGSGYTDSIVYGAFILKNGEPLQGVILGLESEFKEAISYYQDSYDAVELYQMIWAPIQPLIQDHIIHISTSGVLNQVPFIALHDEHGEYLLQDYELHFYQNLRDYYFKDSSKEVDHLESVALFGNPVFDVAPSLEIPETTPAIALNTPSVDWRAAISDSLRTANFLPLPGTQKEIDQIRKLLEEDDVEHVIYVQDSATESQLINCISSRPSIIHLATHGFFFNYIPSKATETNPLRAQIITSPYPMLRSGLALSGANVSWKATELFNTENDGIVTALEISNLDLTSTDLVVLSACETALGENLDNEGVFGLQRSFKAAGVEEIIMSLWKVPDQETAELMTLFYTNLVAKFSPFQALRKAQLTLSQKYPPSYWAGFMLLE